MFRYMVALVILYPFSTVTKPFYFIENSVSFTCNFDTLVVPYMTYNSDKTETVLYLFAFFYSDIFFS